MTRRQSIAPLLATVLGAAAPVGGQEATIQPDLARVSDTAVWEAVGRQPTVLQDAGRPMVRLDETLGSGFARLRDFTFAEGVIELSIRGKNVPQHSFVGVAFHGRDDETYDAVYFRPFNFRSDDSERRSHGVQYVSHPTYTWNKLRAEHTGQYEQPVDPAPDPDDWFRARIVVRGGTVSVYVNDADAPSLVVEQLSDRAGGWLGFWVGNGSGGDFADLRITKDE
jgi:hypothetical protein